MPVYYPPVGFHFSVWFGLEGSTEDHRFQEISGLNQEITTENIVAGGVNEFSYNLPVRTSYQNLVLKRGMLLNSSITGWIRKAVEYFEFKPVDLFVDLLNEEHEILTSWHVINAYPVKWNISDFNAEENKVVIETIELKYQYYVAI